MRGKLSLDDLREGERTLLVALALQRADTCQRHFLRTLLGTSCLKETGPTASVRCSPPQEPGTKWRT
ncbi:hypothetical protein [Streptomyces albireticuli]|uniref:hypothetical protein n=1 Tax=Streptomyces albireticuli TaxID=1940 RepID=UPI0036B02B6E